MKCPRCVRDVPYAVPACGECGFSLEDQDDQFGPDAVCLARVTNAQESLSEDEVRELEVALDEFEKNFPQLFMGIYLAALPAISSVRQFAFWLLNRAAIPSLDITRPNENGCLLVIDLTSGQVVVVVGYLLECYFKETQLEEILTHGRAAMDRGHIARGLLHVIQEFSRQLKRKSKEARRNPRRFDRGHPPEPSRPEFQRLHTPPQETSPQPEPISEP